MNLERMKKLAEKVRTMEHMHTSGYSEIPASPSEITAFNMGFWSSTFECGTCGCLGGTTVLLFGDKNKQQPIAKLAQQFLGLTESEAYQLFNGIGICTPLTDITPEMAIAALDMIIDGVPITDAWHQATATALRLRLRQKK